MSNNEKAMFAGGCFWCLQATFDTINGVESTAVGYTGDSKENASYKKICLGITEHIEVIQISYQPSIVPFISLLNIYWKNIDPTTLNRQFYDEGKQYSTVIYYYSQEQKEEAIKSKILQQEHIKGNKPIATVIRKASPFYKAEEEHQKYYNKNPIAYQQYVDNSNRKYQLKQIWKR